ncbi:MAG: hypothetical protein HY901_05720, partial [Deltaproteobacteria bacterium]|nr:hypothetical protein [Deltaproteobacteria bacterium]
KQKIEEERRAKVEERKRLAEEKKRAAEEAKQKIEEEKRAKVEEQRRLAEAARKAKEEEKARIDAERKAKDEEKKRTTEDARKAKESPPQPAQAAQPAAPPAEPVKPVQVDRNVPGFVEEDAKAAVEAIAKEISLSVLSDNGCPNNGDYVTVKLLAPFDGLDKDARVILRIQNLSLGPTRPGANLAFSGLRRLGRTPDGTFVYCGRGQAFPYKAP